MNKKSIKAIITGGRGFIGSHLDNKLQELGWEVKVFDKKDGNDFTEFNKFNKFTAGFKPDYIFHLGAIPAVKVSITDPVPTMLNNSFGTVNVLETAKEHNVKKVILISSAAVYGARTESADGKISEDRDLNILNPYALSKKWLEDLGRLWASKEIWNGVDTVSVRFFNVYGPRQPKESGYRTCIESFIEQYKENKPFTVVGDGKQRRDFIHVYDVVNAVIKTALSNNVGDGDVINIGSGKSYSVLDVADIVGGKKYPRVFIDARPGEARFVCADISKAKRILKWKPNISLEDGLNELKNL